MDAIFAFPSLLLAIVFAFLLRGPLRRRRRRGGALADRHLHPAVLPGGAQHDRLARGRRRTSRRRGRSARAPFTIMRRYLFGNVVQSVPVIGTLNAADATRHPRRRSGFLGLRHPADRGRRVGLRPAAARSTTPRPASGGPALFPGLAIVLLVTGADPGRRGPQRDPQPDAARADGCQRRSCSPAARGQRPTGASADRRSDERARAGDRDVVIAARDLRVWYGTDARPGPRRRRRLASSCAPGEILGPGRRVRLRQVHARTRAAGPAARGRQADGELRFRGRGPADACAPQGAATRMRGRELGMIFQEPLTRLNPLMRISEHFEETLQAPTSRALARTRSSARSLEALRVMGIPPTRYRVLPARVLRRHAAAADDRADAGAPAGVRRRRRADHRARRTRRGADHPDPARPAARVRHRAAADHPQPRASSPRPATGWR